MTQSQQQWCINSFDQLDGLCEGPGGTRLIIDDCGVVNRISVKEVVQRSLENFGPIHEEDSDGTVGEEYVNIVFIVREQYQKWQRCLTCHSKLLSSERNKV